MNFNYPPLGHNSIRLLEPSTIERDFLSFRMYSYPRTAAPSYTAVSYTWGEGECTETIYINGQPFRVRFNLWACLYHLPQHRNAGWTHLWVDAISIDQTNDQERAAQVRLMDTIYRNAICVSVWLGLPPYKQYPFERHEEQSTQQQIRSFNQVGSNVDFFDAVENLANRPYWSRVWVIQEFLLGRDVELYCGNDRVNWVDFKDLLGRQTESAEYLQERFEYSKYNSGSWTAWPLIIDRHPDRHPEFLQPLYQLLINHCESQCKDPRDRVFALLGLVTIEERSFLERFFPDYTMSEDDVAVIALSHVRQINLEYDGHDNDRLFVGLGINCERRRRRLHNLAKRYDYFSEVRPSQCLWEYGTFEDELYSEETSSWREDIFTDRHEDGGTSQGSSLFARVSLFVCTVVIITVLKVYGRKFPKW